MLDSTDRIAMVGKHGEWYYNFWKDRHNPKGLWRRTTWESYRGGSPEWDVLLDVDALAAAEGEEWVFHGASFLRPAEGEPHRLALLALSPDGGDANRYREFDVESRSFVDPAAGGFDLPTAKGNASWLDADTLLVASTAEGLPSTTSSYARTGVKLRRGESLAAAERLFEIPEDHMMALVAHDSTPGFERTFAVDWISFFEKTTSVLRDGRVGAARRPGGREPQLAPRMAAVPAAEGLDRRRQRATRQDPCSPPTSRPSWPAAGTCPCCSPRMSTRPCSPGAGRGTSCC